MWNLEELSKFYQLTMSWVWTSFVCGASTVLLAVWCTMWRSYRNKKKFLEEKSKLPERLRPELKERSSRLRKGLTSTLESSANADLTSTNSYLEKNSNTDLISKANFLNSIDTVNQPHFKDYINTDTSGENSNMYAVNKVFQVKNDLSQTAAGSFNSRGLINGLRPEDLINIVASKEEHQRIHSDGVLHGIKDTVQRNGSSFSSQDLINEQRSEDTISTVASNQIPNIYTDTGVVQEIKKKTQKSRSSYSSNILVKEHLSDDLINTVSYREHPIIDIDDNVLHEIKCTAQRKASNCGNRGLRYTCSSEDVKNIPISLKKHKSVKDGNENVLDKSAARELSDVQFIGSGSGDSCKSLKKSSDSMDHEKHEQAGITGKARGLFGISPAKDFQVLHVPEVKANVPTSIDEKNVLSLVQNEPLCQRPHFYDFIEKYAPEYRRKKKAAKGKRSKKSKKRNK